VPEGSQVAFLCAEAALDDPDGLCDWEVTGSDVDEVIRSAQDHLWRRHGLQLEPDELRERLHDVRFPVHRRVRGV
jgi:predicted small metal-binding protein